MDRVTQWDPFITYAAGDIVIYDSRVWSALCQTHGEAPGSIRRAGARLVWAIVTSNPAGKATMAAAIDERIGKGA